MVAPVVSLTQNVTYQDELDYKHDQLALLVNLNLDQRDLFRGITFSGGQDKVSGSDGNDGVIGVHGVVIEPLLTLRQSVLYANDLKHLDQHSQWVDGRSVVDDLVDNVTVQGGNDLLLEGGIGNDKLSDDSGDNLLAGDNRNSIRPDMTLGLPPTSMAVLILMSKSTACCLIWYSPAVTTR